MSDFLLVPICSQKRDLASGNSLLSARHGHAGEWNCDDVEAARLQANELARPWGHNQPTPDIAWVEREPITPQDRSSFAASVQQFESEERQQRQQQLLEGMPLGPKDIASCRRVAISPTGCGTAAACRAWPFIVQEKTNYSAH